MKTLLFRLLLHNQTPTCFAQFIDSTTGRHSRHKSAIVKYYIDKGTGPMPLFKYIASAVFGQEAYAGGTLMVVWGLVFTT